MAVIQGVDFRIRVLYCYFMEIGFFFKISILVLALVAVIYAMRLLKSPASKQAADPGSVVGLLAGSDYRLLNWCPENLIKIELYAESGEVIKTLTSQQDFVAVCELMVGGFVQDPARSPVFKTRIKAYPQSGNPVSLDMDFSAKVFQIKGMPFSSPGLLRALDRLTAR